MWREGCGPVERKIVSMIESRERSLKKVEPIMAGRIITQRQGGFYSAADWGWAALAAKLGFVWR